MPASQTITRLPFAFLMTTLHGIPFVLAAAASPKPQKPCRSQPLSPLLPRRSPYSRSKTASRPPTH